MIAAHVVWDQRFTAYDFGAGHPMDPIRLDLTYQLSKHLGLFAQPEIEVVAAEPVNEQTLASIHSAELIRTVQELSREPSAANGQCGVGSMDTPAFLGMHEATSLAVGATVAACRSVWRGQAEHGVNISGGLHHAMPGRASGFCVYNDVAFGIRELLALGARRVAYVDLDVHHGDGVETIFWNDPRVLTISMHESGRFLFPGTGFAADTGGGAAPGTAVNVALPPGTTDRGWLRAFHAVVPALVQAFAPDVIVSQHGCDSHRADPLAHLELTIDGMQAAAAAVHRLSHDVCDGRWVALGGGGYELVDVVPRAWSHLIAIAGHCDLDRGAVVPQLWRDMVLGRCGVHAPLRMGDLGAKPVEYVSWDSGYDPDDVVDAAIMQTRMATFPAHGLDPYFD